MYKTCNDVDVIIRGDSSAVISSVLTTKTDGYEFDISCDLICS